MASIRTSTASLSFLTLRREFCSAPSTSDNHMNKFWAQGPAQLLVRLASEQREKSIITISFLKL